MKTNKSTNTPHVGGGGGDTPPELIQNEVFSLNNKSKEFTFILALEHSIRKLKKEETLFKGEK
jgi:hypothetical protein